MNTRHILISLLLAGAFAPAMADDSQPGATRAALRERLAGIGADTAVMRASLQARFGSALGNMQVISVKNAPYSAEAVSEEVQNLANGNQIVHKSSSMNYRDGAGRTRQEIRSPSGELRRVTIHDPVERIHYVLFPDTKTATKIGPRPELTPAERDKVRNELIVKRVERGDGADGGQRVRENVRIALPNQLVNGAPAPGMEHIGALIAGTLGDQQWSRKAVTKDLGAKEIDGIKALGRLRSYEIPAGAIGNRDAIVVTTETWYAPELKVTLLSKSSDPRSGERSYRLDNLKREEPPAALFAVPSDYTIKEAPLPKLGQAQK